MFKQLLQFLLPTIFTNWFTPTLGTIGSVVGIANGVSNLFSDSPSPQPSRAQGTDPNAYGTAPGGQTGPSNLVANTTASGGGSGQIDLGGHFGPASMYALSAPQYYADGGSTDESSESEMAHGGLSTLEHKPEFYSEGGLKHTYVKGDGDGTSDSVPAMLATGEFVIPSDIVSALGNGNNDSGSKVLDEFLKVIREHKQSHGPDKLPPDSKGPLEYISISHSKVNK